MISLSDHQYSVLDRLRTGSILWGGVGSGKSRTILAYYYFKLSGGLLPYTVKDQDLNVVFENKEWKERENPIPVYIITTAKKRDDLDWKKEAIDFLMYDEITVDSWNNISKYKDIKNAYFIFDEQRVVGSGSWVKSFLRITKENDWNLLSATPGDTWMDYIPIFIANGFYRNRTEFLREHVVYNSFSKYPKVDYFVKTSKLIKQRSQILVKMKYIRMTKRHDKEIILPYNKSLYNIVSKDRWDPYKNEPIKDAGSLCYVMRKVVNTDLSRINTLTKIVDYHPKVIVFYNFNYELDMLLAMTKDLNIPTAQWNGHKHEPIPKANNWIYLVQYTAGAEGWNCIETDVIVFLSQNYSYKILTQSAGRIDRLNTPFIHLYYYHFMSDASIDKGIREALKTKQNFNEVKFSSF